MIVDKSIKNKNKIGMTLTAYGIKKRMEERVF